MKSKAVVDSSDLAQMLRYLVVLELWKGGLSQAEIRSRLGMNTNVLNAMLRGVKRPTDTSN